jgi:hypothetical protein
MTSLVTEDLVSLRVFLMLVRHNLVDLFYGISNRLEDFLNGSLSDRLNDMFSDRRSSSCRGWGWRLRSSHSVTVHRSKASVTRSEESRHTKVHHC